MTVFQFENLQAVKEQKHTHTETLRPIVAGQLF